MGTKLPRKLEQKMQIVGEQIKLARLRRNLSMAQVAERATCSRLRLAGLKRVYRQSLSVFISEFSMRFNWMMIYFCLPKKTRWERLYRI